jgi:hypothetical protein
LLGCLGEGWLLKTATYVRRRLGDG